MPSIVERYVEKFGKSAELYRRGSAAIAGGGHQSRTVDPFPVFVDEAKGALKWDADGNELIDYMMGFGALMLGHAHPVAADAITRRVGQGTHMGTVTALEIRWAEMVQSLIPSAERVRFTSSGSESTMLAFRLARAYSGKTKVLKLREHYHGWHDYVIPGSGLNTAFGVPEETASTVVVAEPDIAAIRRVLEQDRDIAAVILEPTGGHWGQFPLPNPGFLHDLRQVTAEHGVVMIMDEVICGFRMSRGGAQGRFDVLPDLTTMAKIVAGGLPGGAVAGKAEIMGVIGAKDGPTINHPGTFNASPTSAAAGIATLELIANEPINERADAMAARLKEGLRDALTKMEVAGHVHGIASVVHVALGVECGCGGDICTTAHSELAQATASPKAQQVKLAMLNEGVDMMGGIGFMVSAVHTEQEIDRTAEAFEHALAALREDGVV